MAAVQRFISGDALFAVKCNILRIPNCYQLMITSCHADFGLCANSTMRSLIPSRLLASATAIQMARLRAEEPAPRLVENTLGSSQEIFFTINPAFSTHSARLSRVKPHKCQGTSSIGHHGCRRMLRFVFATRCGRPCTFGVASTNTPNVQGL